MEITNQMSTGGAALCAETFAATPFFARLRAPRFDGVVDGTSVPASVAPVTFPASGRVVGSGVAPVGDVAVADQSGVAAPHRADATPTTKDVVPPKPVRPPV